MFTPDYRHMAEVMANRKPARLPLYEHIIGTTFIEKLQRKKFGDLLGGDQADRMEFFRQYCAFYREMTYDTVSWEVCITHVLPGPGALRGGAGAVAESGGY